MARTALHVKMDLEAFDRRVRKASALLHECGVRAAALTTEMRRLQGHKENFTKKQVKDQR
jgi:hypothetical protein